VRRTDKRVVALLLIRTRVPQLIGPPRHDIVRRKPSTIAVPPCCRWTATASPYSSRDRVSNR
jgi:hypothetical protein